jgi:hypothetical protein
VFIVVVALIVLVSFIQQDAGDGIFTDTTPEPELSDKELLDQLQGDTQPMTAEEEAAEIDMLDQLAQQKQNQATSSATSASTSVQTTNTSSADIPDDIDPQSGARNQADLDQLRILEQMSQ